MEGVLKTTVIFRMRGGKLEGLQKSESGLGKVPGKKKKVKAQSIE